MEPGDILLVYLPAYGTVLPFQIEEVVNEPYETIDYGPLPLTTSVAVNYLVTPSGPAPSAVPATGVLPPMAYNASPVTFPLQGAFDPSDMFYFKSPPNKLIYYRLYVRPRWLRVIPEVPIGTFISKYDNVYFSNGGSLAVSVGNFSGIASTGFHRGYAELVQFPDLHYGFIFVNDSTLTAYTSARIEYYELRVGVPSANDAYLAIRGELYRRVVRVVMPVVAQQSELTNTLLRYYGTTGVPPTASQAEVAKALSTMAQAMARAGVS